MQPAEKDPAPNAQARRNRIISLAMSSLMGINAFAGTALMMQPASAEEPAPKLSLELNSLAPAENGCRATFLISNAMGADIKNAALEIALFDKDHLVERLTVIEFGALPADKTKVSQFDFPGADCANISRILINGITECSGASVDAAMCTGALATSTRTEIKFGS